MHVSCSTQWGQNLRNIASIVLYSVLRNQIESESEYLSTSNAVFASTRIECLEWISSVRLPIHHLDTCTVINRVLTFYIAHLPTAILLEVIKQELVSSKHYESFSEFGFFYLKSIVLFHLRGIMQDRL